jgi:hypothetical protein
MIKIKPRLTAETSTLAAITIDKQAAHFINPTTEDRI